MNLANEERMWDNPEEAVLFSIFREGLRRLLNKEEKALARGGTRRLRERWDDKVESIHRALLRAKTLDLTRKFVVEFLADAGGDKALTEHRATIWRMINDRQGWKKVRDLAMLALVTFTDKRLGAEQPADDEAAQQQLNPEGA